MYIHLYVEDFRCCMQIKSKKISYLSLSLLENIRVALFAFPKIHPLSPSWKEYGNTNSEGG